MIISGTHCHHRHGDNKNKTAKGGLGCVHIKGSFENVGNTRPSFYLTLQWFPALLRIKAKLLGMVEWSTVGATSQSSNPGASCDLISILIPGIVPGTQNVLQKYLWARSLNVPDSFCVFLLPEILFP